MFLLLSGWGPVSDTYVTWARVLFLLLSGWPPFLNFVAGGSVPFVSLFLIFYTKWFLHSCFYPALLVEPTLLGTVLLAV